MIAGYHFNCGGMGRTELLTVDDYLRRFENPFDAFYVLEKVDVGICVLDPDTLNFLYLNRKAASVLGYEKHEILGRSYLELIPDRFHAIRKMHRDALDNFGAYGWMDINVYNKSREEIPVKFKGRYVKHGGRQVILSVNQWARQPAKLRKVSAECFTKDIDAMMINELDFDPQWLMDNLPVGVGVATSDGGVRYVNRVHANRLGYDPEEMVGQHNLKFLHPDAAKNPSVIGKFMSVLSFGYHDWYDVEVLHKDGSPVIVNTRATLEKFHNRSCVVGVFDYLS